MQQTPYRAGDRQIRTSEARTANFHRKGRQIFSTIELTIIKEYFTHTPVKPNPSANFAHEVIQSIVTLTEQRDQRSLIQSLLAALAEMLDSAEIWLLDIPTEFEERVEFSLVHGNPATLPRSVLDTGCNLPDTDLFEHINLDGMEYLVVKLRDAEYDRMQLMALAQKRWSDSDQQVLRGMTRVYQNFVELLYDSEKDTLTGLFNRRKLEAKLKDFGVPPPPSRRLADSDHTDYLAIMDLDRFKIVNDTYGHLIGDEVLLTFANILRRTLRDSDLIFRYGGEEFVILLTDTSCDAIAEVLERVRRNVETHEFPMVGNITVSIGYAHLDSHSTPLDVLDKADRALYFVKEHGRNRVCEFDQLIRDGLLIEVHHDGSIELF